MVLPAGFVPGRIRLRTRDELAAMTAACGDAAVDVDADAVIECMADVESDTGRAGTAFQHHDYPGLHELADFHNCNRTPDDDIDVYREPSVIQRYELERLATESPGCARRSSPTSSNWARWA